MNKIVEYQLIYSLKEVRMSQLCAVLGQASLEIYIVIYASSIPEKSSLYGWPNLVIKIIAVKGSTHLTVD